MLYSLRNFDQSEVAQQRVKIINFYHRYGEKATKEAFGADRKVISRWRQRLINLRGQNFKPDSLINQTKTDKKDDD